MATGIAATQLIQYYFYKQTTIISGIASCPCFAITSIADAGNGQLLVTTTDTSSLTVATGITITGTASYDGNYTVISLTPTTFNISGTFGISEVGTWELASNITGAEAGDHLDAGQIFFYDQTDKITLQDTFADRDLTIPNPNPIILDSLGSTPVPYLLDKPYYIEIYDKFNNLVTTLDNYLPTGESDTPTSQLPLENLLPNYGFDTRINANVYDETTVNSNGTTAISAGWFWQIATTETSPANTFTYNALGATAITGSPKNEILLRSTNNTSGQTVNRIYAVLGDYNSLQGIDLALSVTTRLVSGSTETLPVELIRTKNGVEQTPISVGTLSITGTQGASAIVFNVPALTTSDYDNSDELRLAINLPLNEDLQQGYTATWCQISPNNTIADIAISETAGSTDAGKELFGRSLRSLQQQAQYNFRGLPLAIGEGESIVLNKTGTIFIASVGRSYNYAASMVADEDVSPGVELVRDEIIEHTQTNRLIDYLRFHSITQSRHTFLTSVLANVVSVSTGIGTTENSSWQTASVHFTVTKPTEELVHRMKVIALGNGNTDFTFADNFIATTAAFNPAYSPNNDNLFSGQGPGVGPVINWFGTSAFTNTFSNQFDPTLHLDLESNGTATTPAQVRIRFVDAAPFPFLNEVTYSLDEGAGPNGSVYKYVSLAKNIYFGKEDTLRIYRSSVVANQTCNTLTLNYLAYNDILDNPATQGFNPPHSIRFSIDGAAAGAPLGIRTTATVDIHSGDSREIVSQKVSETVNTSFVQDITIVTVPPNGEIIEMSNDITDFNLIFWDTALPRPVNPSLVRKPIYVQFTGALSVNQIATNTATAIDEGVMGIPRAADLGLPFSDNTQQYYMVL